MDDDAAVERVLRSAPEVLGEVMPGLEQVHLAAGQGWLGFAHGRATLHAVGRDRLASAGPHLDTGGRLLKWANNSSDTLQNTVLLTTGFDRIRSDGCCLGDRRAACSTR
jgi:hypothetical protein